MSADRPEPGAPDAAALVAERICSDLRALRVGQADREADLWDLTSGVLLRAGLSFRREVVLDPQRGRVASSLTGRRRYASRIDFLARPGVGIEVKAGALNSAKVLIQLRRYAAAPVVRRLILVAERTPGFDLRDIDGVPLDVVNLQRNWGVAP